MEVNLSTIMDCEDPKQLGLADINSKQSCIKENFLKETQGCHEIKAQWGDPEGDFKLPAQGDSALVEKELEGNSQQMIAQPYKSRE